MTYARVIAKSLADKAADGDYQAARELCDRIEGRPRQALDVVVDIDLRSRCDTAFHAVLKFAQENNLKMSPAQAVAWIVAREPRAEQLLADLIEVQPDEH